MREEKVCQDAAELVSCSNNKHKQFFLFVFKIYSVLYLSKSVHATQLASFSRLDDNNVSPYRQTCQNLDILYLRKSVDTLGKVKVLLHLLYSSKSKKAQVLKYTKYKVQCKYVFFLPLTKQ